MVADDQWEADIRRMFPDWGKDVALEKWSAVKESLSLGEYVSGTVISRAPFGVWLNIGVSFPALLLVVNMAEANERAIAFEAYPQLGSCVSGRINALGEHGEIGVTQQDPDRLLEEAT